MLKLIELSINIHLNLLFEYDDLGELSKIEDYFEELASRG